ncbi:MAG: FecR family protein [Nitrospira sp.]
MTNGTEQDRWREASSEASYWVALSAEEMSVEDTVRFTEWLSADPLHQRAYQDAVRFWQALDSIPGDEVRKLDRYLAASADVDPQVIPEQIPPTPSILKRRPVIGRTQIGAIAASLLLVAGAWWFGSLFHLTADHRTASGEVRTVTLPDGTHIELGPRTSLSVAFDAEHRRVVFHEGEAFFQVASDSTRPFEVEAGEGTIKALGTAFNVHQHSGHVTVTVAEHAVQVSLPSNQPTLRLENGYRVRYDGHGLRGAAEAVDLRRDLAWRRQRLLFDNQPLEDVIDELNRYRDGWIVIRDAALSRLPVTALVDTRYPDRTLRMIEETLPVTSLHLTDRVVLLSRKTFLP